MYKNGKIDTLGAESLIQAENDKWFREQVKKWRNKPENAREIDTFNSFFALRPEDCKSTGRWKGKLLNICQYANKSSTNPMQRY